MSLRDIGVVYHKELIDSLRDRRTVISMTVVPLLLFPALTLGMGLLGATLMSRAKGEVPLVMVVGGEDSPRVVEALKKNKKIEVVPGSADFEDQVSNKTVRAAIILPKGFDAAAEHGEAQTVGVDYYEGGGEHAGRADSLLRHHSFADGRDVSGDGLDRGRKRTRHDGNDFDEPSVTNGFGAREVLHGADGIARDSAAFSDVNGRLVFPGAEHD